MAMTKQEQHESAARILAKEPLTEEELTLLRRYEMEPPYIDDVKELSEFRVCTECGESFEPKKIDGESFTPMQLFADHITKHQPTPGQWAEAYRMIQQGKSKKESDARA